MKLTRTEAIKQGYTIDSHVYPNIAYKGERFNNHTIVHVPTEKEELLTEACELAWQDYEHEKIQLNQDTVDALNTALGKVHPA